MRRVWVNLKFKDKKDIPILQTAISANCNLLITGDKALLELKKIKNVLIIRPADFWKNEQIE